MIRIGIMGYGNLGRGIECAIKQNDDLELVAVFTRRDPATVSILTEGAAVCNVKDVEDWKDKIDVLCYVEEVQQTFLFRHQNMPNYLT